MSNFRRRSRFRRELIEKQPQESLTFASLGSRLAAFKYAPDPELESKHRLENCGNIFIGACSKCTVHSASTFLKDSLSNFACMQNSLEGRNTTTEPSKASSLPAEIDFQEEISNHRYVRALEAKGETTDDVTTVFPCLKGMKTWTYSIFLWIRQRILRWLFPQGIFYHPGQLEVLERCAVSQTPFLFLPVHKSQIDLLLVKHVLGKTKNRLDDRTFVAFRPLSEMPIQPGFQLQSPQEFSRDVPWAVQQSLVESVVKRKGHLLAFLEPLPAWELRPNLALDTSILDHALQCIYDNIVHDIQIVPVGISYEGQHPPPTWPCGFTQCVKAFLKSWISPNYARVDFDQPFSLKEFSDHYLYRDLDHEAMKMTLGLHVMSTSWHTSRIMISNLLSFLHSHSLVPSKAKILEDIQRHQRFFHEGLRAQLLEASSNGGRLNAITNQNILSNPVASIYAAESVCLTALLSLIKLPSSLRAFQATNANVTVKRVELVERSLVAFDLLSYEDYFSLLACAEMMADVLERALDFLKLKDIIFIKEEIKSENFQEQWARRLARNLERDMIEENEVVEYEEDILYHVCLSKESMKAMTFYLGIYGPIFRTYYAVVRYLDTFTMDVEAHIKVSKLVEDTGYGEDSVQRVLNRLWDMTAIYYCDEKYDCVHKAVKSLKSLKSEISKFLVEI